MRSLRMGVSISRSWGGYDPSDLVVVRLCAAGDDILEKKVGFIDSDI